MFYHKEWRRKQCNSLEVTGFFYIDSTSNFYQSINVLTLILISSIHISYLKQQKASHVDDEEEEESEEDEEEEPKLKYERLGNAVNDILKGEECASCMAVHSKVI